MKIKSAVDALSALAHEGRLSAFRLLVEAGHDGMAAGRIAQELGVAASTLSASLNILSNAGLVTSRRNGRSIIYAAAYPRMTEMLAFLIEDCCQGSPALCAPLTAILARSRCCDDAIERTGA